ncbi:MAG: hypothetical protein AAFR52_13235 [Pseudomonadota bacterium]
MSKGWLDAIPALSPLPVRPSTQAAQAPPADPATAPALDPEIEALMATGPVTDPTGLQALVILPAVLVAIVGALALRRARAHRQSRPRNHD